MFLDENSSRDEILNYIKNSPITFLLNFSDESWSQTYMDEAAKEIVKVNPYFFLHNFSNKPWAQSYVDEAVKEAAKLDPKYFIEKWADRFPQYINLALFALVGKNETK